MKAAVLCFALLLSLSALAAPATEKAPKSKAAIAAATFPGGDVALNGFKSAILTRVIRTGIAQGLPAGSYEVQIRFDIDAQGNVGNIHALSTIGYGLEQEALSQFARSGRWTPARTEGRKVKATQVQSFRFDVL
ncbi:hypothetical protein EPD60_10405 [Flaviaesturariibacter flavus]|uniref:TonB C-terminal domain-containing protein n=1 Tax=Flaviaesturariibacter flavus TaxID=2502780 RepID=A0A4R1BBJ9_9BACT|nr:energy transducer TonB [Flaviaesturariibacter flavus]TCJ14395.1 hypothetical protein EPD60_10405 [Flaviaesturariibacter flavus]